MLKILFPLIAILLVAFSSAFAQTDISTEAISNMEEGLKVNEALLDFFQDHPCEIGMQPGCNRPLASHDIELMKDLLRDLGSWKKDAFEHIFTSTDVIKGLPFVLKRGNSLKIIEKLTLGGKYLDITYNPKEEASLAFTQKVRINTVIALVLYDHFFRLADVLSKAKKIRSILAYDMGEDGKILEDTMKFAMDEKLWNKTKNNLTFLSKEKALSVKEYETSSERYFNQYLEKSFTADKMRSNDSDYRLRTILFLDHLSSQTRFYEAIDRLIFKISRLFGNAAGTVQSRDGKLKALANDPMTMKRLKSKLRPLDIFLEKTPFRLTDKFIPGYYGHVAIWLGTPEQLMDMKVSYEGRVIPLLDHPKMGPYLESMSQGKLIVEALREPGVTMNTFEHFLDIDDLLVVQSTDKGLSPGEHILRAIDQVGKPYDFNFDIETERAIVCSELVYTVFNDLEWPIDRSFGRYTISPDHVAWKSIDYCFAPKIMYVDGKEIQGNMMAELKRVLSLPGGISYTPTGSCR